MKKIIDVFGGRKFFYGLIFQLTATIMLCINKIDGEQYVYVMLIIYGTMAGTNAITTSFQITKGNNGQVSSNPDEPPRN